MADGDRCCGASDEREGGRISGSRFAAEFGPTARFGIDAAFERRRNLVVAGVAGIPGLTQAPPDGAFYAISAARG